ncbi:YbbM seven transmembrane helix protein [Salmonella enterica subsp. salamae]|nr:YbbM seven transmembrane helix protein [Salmonella enterica subsp. salamae]
MNEHNITNTSLALSMLLVVVAMLISHKEKLALEKDILWSVCRAVIQLIIVGYVLKYIFGVNHAALTLLMVLFICFNAAWNAQKRSKYIDKAFLSSFIAITVGAGLTLTVLVLTGSIEFAPMQVIPIAGMVAGNAMVAVGLCYNQLGLRFHSEQQANPGKVKFGRHAENGLRRAYPRQYPRVAYPDDRLGKDRWAGEPAGDDVRADFCRNRSGKSD